jgi:hypothetical protein
MEVKGVKVARAAIKLSKRLREQKPKCKNPRGNEENEELSKNLGFFLHLYFI